MTDNEEKVFQIIFNFIREYSYPPTIREIADIMHYDRKYIGNVVKSLKKKNYITYQERKVRTIVILDALN